MPSVGQLAQVACLWEATARKPGNVHRYRDFDDLTYHDFLLAAVAVGQVMEGARAAERLGRVVLDGVEQTRDFVRTNANLGILLLFAPLAAADTSAAPHPWPALRYGVPDLLAKLDLEDSRLVYRAIRQARPGGLGRAPEQDIYDEPTLPLREVMALAAGRDLVARQYANGFREVFEEGVPALEYGAEQIGCLEGAILFCHLFLMSKYPDSLIARKRGRAEAEEASRRAAEVLVSGWPGTAEGQDDFHDLDAWLRAEGHGRNPGTTADLVAASLFAALRAGILTLPASLPWTTPSLISKKEGISPTPGDCRER